MEEMSELRSLLRTWVELSTMRTLQGMSLDARSMGLSMPQYSLLMRLFHAGGCEVHDVGRGFGVTPAAASQLVDKLVQAGLVARTESPQDRRVRLIELTPRGRDFVREGHARRFHWLDKLAASVGAEERAGLVRSLRRLIEAEKALPRGAHRDGEAIKPVPARP